MAATNRQDILDPALLRPGRFDRQIYVGYPDVKGREEILKVHARGKPLAEDVDLAHTGQGSTAGFTGADLENLMNEGALLAARDERHFITMDDLQEAMIKVIAGPEKKSRVVTESRPAADRLPRGGPRRGHAHPAHPRPGAPDHHRAPGTGRRHDHHPARGGSNLSAPAPNCMRTSSPCWAAGAPRRWCWATSPPAHPTTSSAPTPSPAIWSPSTA